MTILRFFKQNKIPEIDETRKVLRKFRRELDDFMRDVKEDYYIMEYGIGKTKKLLDQTFTFKVKQFTNKYIEDLDELTKHRITRYVDNNIIPQIENYVLFC